MFHRRSGLVCCAALIAAVIMVLMVRRRDDSQEIMDRALRELRTGDSETALKLAEQLLVRNSDSLAAVRIAAMAHADLDHYLEAAELFIRLPEGTEAARDSLHRGANRLQEQGSWLQCETLLRKCTELFPDDVPAHRQLAALLNASARRWDSVPYGMRCIEAGQFSVTELLLWGNPEEVYENQELLPEAAQRAPKDPLVMTGIAAGAIRSHDIGKALALLKSVTTRHPSSIEAQALLGGLLLDQHDLVGLAEWHRSLSADANAHPGIWFVRSRWCQQTGQTEAAARCCWEAVQRAPYHRLASFQLGQLLTELGRPDDAQPFLDRARQLAELHEIMRPIYFRGPEPSSMLQIARIMESLERLPEARAWYFAVSRFAPQESSAVAALLRLDLTTADDPGQKAEDVAAVGPPASQLDLSALPLPDWTVPDVPVTGLTATASSWLFRDVAAAAGIRFEYFNSDDPSTEGRRMIETTGGGAAAADFDRDGWPDLYLTQGCLWPVIPGLAAPADHCYRNTGQGTFRECAEVSGLIDSGFGQGVSAGDFDNDGFPDLYVGNLGQNRLFQNNGDGTFDDVTREIVAPEDLWTTSCMIADLNGDGHPDLYDANYLSGPEAYEVICGSDHPRTCSPASFRGVKQQILLNQGNTTWRDAAAESGLATLEGKALGVVAVHLTDASVPELLVANDGEANFFFRQSNETAQGVTRFDDIAVPAGLAFDRDGLAQACMGIAVDDVNGDARLDFFITNFYDESNTLYVQKPGLLFADETRQAGLRSPSLRMLGFGTQFLDVDLDGQPDLVVANGHVDDFSFEGKAFRMPPQLFHNVGQGQFREVLSERSDSYFSGRYLGRGLARLDWNRDGREDFAVSHLHSPAALVSNETPDTGNAMTIRLIGTFSGRDAVGTTVTMNSTGRSRMRQLTAGDGYQASNERALIFGLGERTIAEEIMIRWPAGSEQRLTDLKAGFEYHVIEGRSTVVAIPLESIIRE